ncbi:MAG: molecular chaperone DnaK [Candidatus Dojkabacteria bacterium]|nr:molecular chaperone DnaK [Candidatus Dojkabacteria bacterium]
MSKIVGIDLGTTNSVVSVMQGGNPTVIPNAQGARLTPSVAALGNDGELIVGAPARNQAVTNPENTIYSVKRFIGRRWNDEEVKRSREMLPFEMREAKNGGVEIKFGDSWLTPQEVSAKVLQKMKTDAEAFLGEEVKEAVITVPAYFDDSQRQATKDAGKIAGFDVKRIINEPTAAALAYGLENKKEQKVAVFDLGGGTFDISILEIGDGVFEVLSTNGDTFLGGDDFDAVIVDFLADEFKAKEGIDLREDRTALQRLKEAAEKAKIELSSSEKTTINLPFVTADEKGAKHLNREMTRSELEKLVSHLVDRVVEPSRKALNDAKLKPEDVHEVLLVGGMTRMPLVQQKVEDIFGKEGNKTVNPDEVVSIGAAIQAGVLGGEVHDITLLDVTPLSLGVETLGGVMTKLIERNTTIPVEKKQTFSTAADNQPGVEVHVLQGEREMAADNKSLGRFILDGIPPAPRGVPQIEVTYKIDANGILNVTAQDKATGKKQAITITASTGLDKGEIDRMVEEAAKHATDDKKKKERAEVRNNADTLAFSAKRLLDDSKDKIEEAQRKEIEERVEKLRAEIAKDDFDVSIVKDMTEELSKKMQDVGTKLYETAAKEAEKEDAAKAKKGSEDTGGQNDTPKGKSDKKDDDGDVKEGEVL